MAVFSPSGIGAKAGRKQDAQPKTKTGLKARNATRNALCRISGIGKLKPYRLNVFTWKTVSMVAVWLIRHGESESNAGLPTTDSSSIQLTPRGWEQAECVARSLPLPDLIVTSPYLRAKQTAQPTFDRFPDCPQREWAVQEFTYLSRIAGQQTTLEERRPLVEAYWERSDPFYIDGGKAESFADLMQRVQQMQQHIEQLAQEEFVVVFSHAVFIRAVLWSWLSGPVEITSDNMNRFRSFIKSLRIPNASIVKTHFQHGEIFFTGVITSHLSQDWNGF